MKYWAKKSNKLKLWETKNQAFKKRRKSGQKYSNFIATKIFNKISINMKVLVVSKKLQRKFYQVGLSNQIFNNLLYNN